MNYQYPHLAIWLYYLLFDVPFFHFPFFHFLQPNPCRKAVPCDSTNTYPPHFYLFPFVFFLSHSWFSPSSSPEPPPPFALIFPFSFYLFPSTSLPLPFALCLLPLLAAGCRQDMHDAPRYDPLEESAIWRNGMRSARRMISTPASWSGLSVFDFLVKTGLCLFLRWILKSESNRSILSSPCLWTEHHSRQSMLAGWWVSAWSSTQ